MSRLLIAWGRKEPKNQQHAFDPVAQDYSTSNISNIKICGISDYGESY